MIGCHPPLPYSTHAVELDPTPGSHGSHTVFIRILSFPVHHTHSSQHLSISSRPDARTIPESLTSPIPIFGTSTPGIPEHGLPLLHLSRPRNNARDYALQYGRRIWSSDLQPHSRPHQLILTCGWRYAHTSPLGGVNTSRQPAAGPSPESSPPGQGNRCIQHETARRRHRTART